MPRLHHRRQRFVELLGLVLQRRAHVVMGGQAKTEEIAARTGRPDWKKTRSRRAKTKTRTKTRKTSFGTMLRWLRVACA